MIPMCRYTCVLFDADETLLDFVKSEHIAFEKTFAQNGIALSDEMRRRYREINQGLWRQFEQGAVTKAELIVRRFDELFAEFGFDIDGRWFNDRYFENLSQNGYIIDGADRLCRRLKEKNISLWLITNGVEYVQKSRFAKSGLEKYFDGVFISETVGAGKPHRKYFDYVLSHIPEKDTSKIIVVGDSPTTDIAGGAAAGLDTCLFARGETAPCAAKFTASTLDAVGDIILKNGEQKQ